MSFWKSKPAEPEAKSPWVLRHEARVADKPQRQELEFKVFSRFPVGSSILYLGAEMRVTAHEDFWEGFPDPHVPGRNSALVCEYRSTDGHFHEKRFEYQHFTAIAKGFQP